MVTKASEIATKPCGLCGRRVDSESSIVGLCAGCAREMHRRGRALSINLARATGATIDGVKLWRWRGVLRLDSVDLVPSSASFCGQCIEGTEGLEFELRDGRRVAICQRCRDEHPRRGGYVFCERSDNYKSERGRRRDGNRRVPPGQGRQA